MRIRYNNYSATLAAVGCNGIAHTLSDGRLEPSIMILYRLWFTAFEWNNEYDIIEVDRRLAKLMNDEALLTAIRETKDLYGPEGPTFYDIVNRLLIRIIVETDADELDENAFLTEPNDASECAPTDQEESQELFNYPKMAAAASR
jgi:hypothetical protein